MSHIESSKDERAGVLVLVSGQDAKEQPQYAYALIPLQNYPAFREAERAGDYDLAYFGEVLATGEGAEPPLAVQREMQTKYGANHRFEEDVQKMTEWVFKHWRRRL